jgi:hypothetical protein
MHIFNVSITTVQGLKNVGLKVWEELITQNKCRLFKTCWNKSTANGTKYARQIFKEAMILTID